MLTNFFNIFWKYTTIYDLLTFEHDLQRDLADIYLSLGCIILPSCIVFTKLNVFEKKQSLTSMTCDLDLNLTLQKDSLFTYYTTVLSFIAFWLYIVFKLLIKYDLCDLDLNGIQKLNWQSFLGSHLVHRPDYRKIWEFFMCFLCTNIRVSSMEKKAYNE
jgi:hypothetical protein